VRETTRSDPATSSYECSPVSIISLKWTETLAASMSRWRVEEWMSSETLLRRSCFCFFLQRERERKEEVERSLETEEKKGESHRASDDDEFFSFSFSLFLYFSPSYLLGPLAKHEEQRVDDV